MDRKRRKKLNTHIKTSLVNQLGVIFFGLILGLTACQVDQRVDVNNQTEKVKPILKKTDIGLGTVVTLTLYNARPADSDECFKLLQTIENKLSFHQSGSAINQINQLAGRQSVIVDEEVYSLIKQAYDYSSLTEGHFNMSLGPITELWKIGTEQAKVPKDEIIKRKLALTDYQLITFNEERKSVFLEKEGMAVDLGGIAKGYASQKLRTLLSKKGIESALIYLGGNIEAIGSKPDGQPFKIGIKNPLAEGYFGILSLKNQSVVTSGPYERFFIDNGVRYHHIFDSQTGYPVVNELVSVSIIATDTTKADALSTAVYSMGLAEGLRFLDKQSAIEYIIVTQDKTVYCSKEIKQYFEIVEKGFKFNEEE